MNLIKLSNYVRVQQHQRQLERTHRVRSHADDWLRHLANANEAHMYSNTTETFIHGHPAAFSQNPGFSVTDTSPLGECILCKRLLYVCMYE